MPDEILKQPVALPRRFILGALTTAAAVGGAAALGLVGFGAAPSSADFQFTRGISFASGEEARLKAYIATYAAQEDIAFRIVGHSGTSGADEANLELSQQRAELAETLALEQAIAPSRIVAVTGVGGGDQLSRNNDETDREYQSRLSRVTITTFRTQN